MFTCFVLPCIHCSGGAYGVLLHYYEGYTAEEIGKILGKKTNTVYTMLTRARALLKEKLGGEEYG